MYSSNERGGVMFSSRISRYETIVLSAGIILIVMGCVFDPKLAFVLLGVVPLFASLIGCIALKECYVKWRIERDTKETVVGYFIGLAAIDHCFLYSEQLYFSPSLENYQCTLVCMTPQQAQLWQSIPRGTKVKVSLYKKEKQDFHYCKIPPIIVG